MYSSTKTATGKYTEKVQNCECASSDEYYPSNKDGKFSERLCTVN